MKKLMLVIIFMISFSITANAVSYTLTENTTGQILTQNDADICVNSGVLSKLMTALITAEKIESGELSKEKLVAVNSAVNGTGGAVVWLTGGERITVHELLKGLLTGNANDCQVALACEIAGSKDEFTKLMNERAKSLNMNDTFFNDCISDCDTTPADMSKLCLEVRGHENLREYMTTFMDYIRNGETMLVNNNKLVRSYNGIEGLIAGATEKSGWCVAASATKEDKSYSCVVMGANDEDEAIIKAKELLNLGFSSYCVYTPEIDESLLQPISVKKGVQKSIEIAVNGAKSVVIQNGEQDLIEYEVNTEPILVAPVAENQCVGTLIIKKNDEVISTCDIVTRQKIEKMTIWKYFTSFMRSFFILNF